MAAAPIYAATPLAGHCIVPATFDASLTAPALAHTAVLIPAQANGCRIELIRYVQIASLASAATVNLFIFDGTTYWFFDFYTDTNTVALSATTELTPVDIPYDHLILPGGSSLVVTTPAAVGQSAFAVHAFGGAF